MRGVNIVSLATHLYGVRQTYTGRPAHESRQHEVPQYIEGRRDATSQKQRLDQIGEIGDKSG